MCQMASIETNYGVKQQVADIKKDYITNIISSAAHSPNISRIVLFGSAATDRCQDHSDIDIAIWGDLPEHRYLTSLEYKNFERLVYSYGNFQDYDVLYFQNGRKNKSFIMSEIEKGRIIYRREGIL